MKNVSEAMYSVEESVFIVLDYHRLNPSPTSTRRSFQMRFKVRKGPDEKTIRDLFQKFQQNANVADALVGNLGPTHSILTPENATLLAAVVQLHPTTSVLRFAAQSGITPSSTWIILRKRPYTCFRARLNTGPPYQFEPNDNGRISLTSCST